MPPSVTKDCRQVLLSTAESARFYFFLLSPHFCGSTPSGCSSFREKQATIDVDELLSIRWSERRKWEGKSPFLTLSLFISLFTVMRPSLFSPHTLSYLLFFPPFFRNVVFVTRFTSYFLPLRFHSLARTFNYLILFLSQYRPVIIFLNFKQTTSFSSEDEKQEPSLALHSHFLTCRGKCVGFSNKLNFYRYFAIVSVLFDVVCTVHHLTICI